MFRKRPPAPAASSPVPLMSAAVESIRSRESGTFGTAWTARTLITSSGSRLRIRTYATEHISMIHGELFGACNTLRCQIQLTLAISTLLVSTAYFTACHSEMIHCCLAIRTSSVKHQILGHQGALTVRENCNILHLCLGISVKWMSMQSAQCQFGMSCINI